MLYKMISAQFNRSTNTKAYQHSTAASLLYHQPGVDKQTKSTIHPLKEPSTTTMPHKCNRAISGDTLLFQKHLSIPAYTVSPLFAASSRPLPPRLTEIVMQSALTAKISIL
jgi:hypothetical protein